MGLTLVVMSKYVEAHVRTCACSVVPRPHLYLRTVLLCVREILLPYVWTKKQAADVFYDRNCAIHLQCFTSHVCNFTVLYETIE